MSATPELRPNPLVVPVFATAAYLAGLVGLWGFTSLLLARDVIDYPDAGLFVGPAMAVAGCVATFFGTLAARRSPAPLLAGAVTALAALAGILLVGATGYSFARGSFAVFPSAVLHFALSPFMLGAALLTGIVAGGAAGLTRPRGSRA